jgi:hypothetical protein
MADETIVPHIDILIFLSWKGNRQGRAGKRFKTEYSGTKCGRFLSFVTSSPLSKDAKFFNKGISTIEILEKNKKDSSVRMHRKCFLFEVSWSKISRKKKDRNGSWKNH